MSIEDAINRLAAAVEKHADAMLQTARPSIDALLPDPDDLGKPEVLQELVEEDNAPEPKQVEEPETETGAAEQDPFEEALDGKKRTKTLALPDGTKVSEGDTIQVSGIRFEVQATFRGGAVVLGEDGEYLTIDSADIETKVLDEQPEEEEQAEEDTAPEPKLEQAEDAKEDIEATLSGAKAAVREAVAAGVAAEDIKRVITSNGADRLGEMTVDQLMGTINGLRKLIELEAA